MDLIHPPSARIRTQMHWLWETVVANPATERGAVVDDAGSPQITKSQVLVHVFLVAQDYRND